MSNEKLAARLEKFADGLDSQIEDKRNSNKGARLTPRRQRQIDSAARDADDLEAAQVILRALADLHVNGGPPEFLEGVKTKKAVIEIAERVDSRRRWGKDPEWWASDFSADYLQALDWATDLINGQDYGDRDTERLIARKIAEAELNRPDSYFSTPEAVSKGFLFPAVYRQSYEAIRVLEPEAGSGALADSIKEEWPNATIDCIEVVHSLREILELKGYNLVGRDFLNQVPDPDRLYDVIIMNPPFEKGADAEHIRHAFRFLANGGTLVSVASNSLKFNKNRKYTEFRDWLDDHYGEIGDLPDGSFKPATGVSTVYVMVEK